MKHFSLIFLLCLSLIISCKNPSPSNIKTEEQNPPAVSASPVQNSENALKYCNLSEWFFDRLSNVQKALDSPVLPIGSIVTVKEETEIYITPNIRFDKCERKLQKGELLYIQNIDCRNDFAENSYDDFHLIKVLASDGLEGWVVAVNLYLIENTHAKQSLEKISCTAKEKLLDSDMEIFGNESHPDEEAYFKANYRKIPGFECKSFAILPEKDLALCAINCAEPSFSGLYFYRLSTMELLKIEATPIFYDLLLCPDEKISVNADRTKIGFWAEDRFNKNFYVFSADFSDVESLAGKSSFYENTAEDEKGKAKLQKAEAISKAKDYLYKGRFEGFCYKTEGATLEFGADDFYTVKFEYENESSVAIGTYYIEYDSEYCRVKLSPILAFSNYWERPYPFSLKAFYTAPKPSMKILPEKKSFDYTGGLVEPETNIILFMDVSHENPGGEFEFDGVNFLKYPINGYNYKFFRIDRNMTLKNGPSLDAKDITVPYFNSKYEYYEDCPYKRHGFPYSEYLFGPKTGEITELKEDSSVFAIAETKEQDTIDGITAPWILCAGFSAYEPDVYQALSELFWVFSGFCTDQSDK